MRWLPLLAAAAVALALVACNGGAGGEDAVRKTIEDFYNALNDDPPKAYTYLAQDCKDDTSYADFAFGLFYLERVFGDSDVEVKSIEVVEHDSKAISARFHVVLISDGEEIALFDKEDEEEAKHFVKEDGRWRLADCEDYAGGVDTGDGGSGDATPTPANAESPYADAIAAEANDDPSLPGEYVDLPEIYGGYYGNRDGPSTADHMDGPIDYSIQGLPPAGGPHWGNSACGNDPTDTLPLCGPVPWGIYRSPWPAESVVHNMEHAGVIIWHNTSDQAAIDDLEAFAKRQLEDGTKLVLMPYPDMDPESVAITVWSRRDKFPVNEYSRARLQNFLDLLYCRFDPEDFCPEPADTPQDASPATRSG